MLTLLLDEHISTKIDEQLRIRQPNLTVYALATWEGGQHLGDNDIDLLRYTHAGQITLVTYDIRTIAPLLKLWTEQQISHGGVIFIDTRTYRPNNFGGLVTAIEKLWLERNALDWKNKVLFLNR